MRWEGLDIVDLGALAWVVYEEPAVIPTYTEMLMRNTGCVI
jgi:hypothetical protein